MRGSGVQTARTAAISPTPGYLGGWDVQGKADSRWQPVPDYESYEAHPDGYIRSIDHEVRSRGGGTRMVRGRVLNPTTRPDGYRQICLSQDGVKRLYLVHCVIARTFLGPRPDGFDVCHGDGNKANNRVENLRYDSKSANNRDQVLHGTHSLARRTHCKNGHEWTADAVRSPRGHRVCVECKAIRNRSYYLRRTQTHVHG